MASIYWVGRSAYLNWRQNGTRHRESLGQVTKDEAETARRTKELELRTGKRILSNAELFRDFALTYLEWHEAEYPDSHDRIEYIIVKVFKEFRDYPLDKITPYEIEQWKHRRARKVSDGTVLKELRTLSALFNRAIIWGQLSTNPVKMVKKPKDHSGEPPTWFTPEQLQALYDVSGHRAHWWRLMANTGMRRSEAQHLRWQDVRDGRLHILSREGARTKSGKWRQVPLSKGAQAALDALRPEKDIPEYVLPPMVGRSLTRHFTKDAEKAGIPGTLHSLRHTFAATLVQRGRPLREVQELMGHASITTTQIYAHLAPENLEAAVTVLDL